MCLIVHKPAGVTIPHDLLEAAARLNPDGWGLVGHDGSGALLVERHASLDLDALLATERRLRGAEYALHLRQRTRGRVEHDNTHPFGIGRGVYLMHNGTLPLEGKAGHSDTRTFVETVLRPLVRRYDGLLSDATFHRLLAFAIPPDDKIVLYEHPLRRFHIVNRGRGAEFGGLWLSNTRWIDRSRFVLEGHAAVQQRSWRAAEVAFL